ncbi:MULTISPECIES: ferritin-like domain-containing protein [Actinomadura]|jgi:hypothetical protein|uniref:Iminophenyl-pyruvate dimer synthase domain-containing protein n=1 Tax=Actinomadura geliboluensis TaxID=882440 RepID=A0A5S4GX02_9ACTN|nr:ferritin-like protein [Actinomadura geliboluensis]TMR31020.1 hypothetical protein ETD96_32505 [Actinomadura geliboluensis]
MTLASTTEIAEPTPVAETDPTKEITSVAELARHLHAAAQVEMSTIPLYLFALYSLRVGGHSQWSAPRGVLRTMTGIAIEEMLHLALVRNLMVAIGHGDDIRFYDRAFLPSYSSYMLHRYNPKDEEGARIVLELKRLSKKHVGSFRRVEMPDNVDKTATTFRAHDTDPLQYTSLGAFYRAIELGFRSLDGKIEWAIPDVRKQYKRGFWNEYGNFKPIRVYDQATAKQALDLIIEQGEGTVREHERIEVGRGVDDYTHYQKFLRIEQGVEGIGAGDGTPDKEIDLDDPLMTWPVVSNPKIEEFTDQPAVHSLMELFNAAFCYTLCLLDETYRHTTRDVRTVKVPGTLREEKYSRRYGLERNGIAAMQGVLYPIAQALVSTPIEGDGERRNAAPSFQFFDFDARPDVPKKTQLAQLCDKAVQHCPQLGGPDGVSRQISLLTEV